MRRTAVGFVLTAIGVGFVVELLARDVVLEPIVANLVTLGVVASLVGIVVAGATARRTGGGVIGPLLAIVVGFAVAGVWRFSDHAWAATVGQLVFLATPLVGLLVVSAVLGGSSPQAQRGIRAVITAAAVLGMAVMLASSDGVPGWTVAGEDRVVDNRLAVGMSLDAGDLMLGLWAVTTAGGALVGVAFILWDWSKAPRGVVRSGMPLAVAAAWWGITVAACALTAAWADEPGTAGVVSTSATVAVPLLGVAGLSCAIGWVELVRPRLTRARDGALELPSEGVGGDALRSWLRDLTGDPSLELRYASGDGWIDAEGRRREPDGARRLLVLNRQARPVAALEHDPSVPADVLALAAQLAGASIDAERSSAIARGRAEAVRDATARLVRAGDVAADQLTHDLVMGPISGLEGLAERLRRDPGAVAEVAPVLRHLAAEVRALSHGLYPATLDDGGLAAALELHADVPAGRFPSVIEHTVYRLAVDDRDARVTVEEGGLRVELTGALRPPDEDRVIVLGGTVTDLVALVPTAPEDRTER